MWRVLLLLLVVNAIYAVHTSIQNTFNKNKIIFNHLAVDYETSEVYVGAVNRIFQLSQDLQVAQTVVTGPVYDSQLCSFDCHGIAKVSKDNFNKVLLIDYAHNRLITCGSVSQGMCSSRSRNNIHISHDVPKAVAANDPTASTVAFLAPGPPDPNTTQVMYTGVTFTGSFAHRYHVPAVSSLSLEDHRLFDIATTFCEFCHSDQVTGTRLYINTIYRDQYIINYVYGFSSGTFSYFLTTQQNTDGGYHSKIIRICHSDEQYHSYTEIPISCKRNGSNVHSLVEAGFVAKPGTNLAKKLGISEKQDVLYTLFNLQERNHTSTANMSALCVYTIRDINKKIGARIENCFKGEGMRGLPHVLPNRKCIKHKLKTKGSEFCGTNVNSPLGSDLPIEMRPMAEFKETLTSIAATSVGNQSVVFTGTTQGHLKKIMIESATYAFEYGDIVVDEGSPVNKDLIFNAQQKYLYVMTKHRVSKVKVHQCSEFKSCSTCVRAGDPFCGWCVVENKCSIQSECQNAREDPLFWLTYNITQCTVIAQVTPIHIQRKYESVMQSFTNPVSAPSSLFNHLVVNRNTGHVYIGAVNRIYQLSSELEVTQWIVTGPVNDSYVCIFDCPSDHVRKLTDNVNKALVIDYRNNRLITCGSVYQGICSVRNLNNISQDIREVREAIVANDAKASTVAFIGPGPPNPPMTQVMYVGVTYTNNSPYRSEIPAVSSRSLEDDRLFMIARTAVTSGTRMFVNSLSQERYPIKYVYGFSSEGFSYFLTIQLTYITSETYHSKLVRVCHDDEEYNSYTEIPISCKTGSGMNNDYNLVQAAFVGKAGTLLADELGITAQDDVLFAAFSVSESVYTNTTSDYSALCVYSLKAIRRKFMQTIKNCFSGNGYRGLDFIMPPGPCITTRFKSISEDFCGLPVNAPLGGDQPVEAEPVAVFTTRLTAVAATTTGYNTVVFAGTAQGHLKKILVESATNAVEYDDIIIDEGYKINEDLVFDTQQMHLYVMTERKVSKLKVHQCGEHKKCFSCVAIKDPYCEWCEVDKKCGPRAQCRKFDVNNTHCSYSIQDTTIGRTTEAPLQLLVENMPIDNVELLCVFTLPSGTVVMNATRREYGVDCLTPDSDKLPRAPVGLHEYSAKLAVTTVNGSEFAATKIMFFVCSSYISCTECTNSPFGCNWDLSDSICIDTIGHDRNMIVTNTLSTRQGQKTRSVCPKLLAPERIWVPAGFKVNVKVKVGGIRPDMAEKLYCMYKVDARTKVNNGKLHNDVVHCDGTILDYESNSPVVSASLTVAWDEWKRLDNPHRVHLKIYKCTLMAYEENSCKLLPDKYRCHWNTKGTCEYQTTRGNYSEALLPDISSLEWR